MTDGNHLPRRRLPFSSEVRPILHYTFSALNLPSRGKVTQYCPSSRFVGNMAFPLSATSPSSPRTNASLNDTPLPKATPSLKKPSESQSQHSSQYISMVDLFRLSRFEQEPLYQYSCIRQRHVRVDPIDRSTSCNDETCPMCRGLFRLPAELRIRIYEMVLAPPKDLRLHQCTIKTRRSPSKHGLPLFEFDRKPIFAHWAFGLTTFALLATCPGVREDAAPAAVGLTTFALRFDIEAVLDGKCPGFVERLEPHLRPYVRSIAVEDEYAQAVMHRKLGLGPLLVRFPTVIWQTLAGWNSDDKIDVTGPLCGKAAGFAPNELVVQIWDWSWPLVDTCMFLRRCTLNVKTAVLRGQNKGMTCKRTKPYNMALQGSKIPDQLRLRWFVNETGREGWELLDAQEGDLDDIRYP